MGKRKKKSSKRSRNSTASSGASSHTSASDFQRKDILQAVLLADSFSVKLRPITFEGPKMLLPVVNVPMIEYALEFLASSGVDEIIVLCCAHAERIKAYLDASIWVRRAPQLVVQVLTSERLNSAGEALRYLHGLDLIHSDFVLMTGDVVSNFDLSRAVAAHRARVKEDPRNILTVVMKKVAFDHHTRSWSDDLVVAMAAGKPQILKYSNSPRDANFELDVAQWEEHDGVRYRCDLMDCFVDICSPEVLALFADNFDWQELRTDFLAGVLGSEILGNRIFVHEIHGEYAARIHDYRTYDAVSRDIIHRWVYPMVPDNNTLGLATSYTFTRGNIYKEVDPHCRVHLSRSCGVGRATVLAGRTEVGDHTHISESVVGRDCVIGRNCVITGSYIFDGCRIEDGAVIERAVVCNGAVVRKNARIAPGCVLSYNVVIDEGVELSAFSKVTTRPLARHEDDEEVLFAEEQELLEEQEADSTKRGAERHPSSHSDGGERRVCDPDLVGPNGLGRLYEYGEVGDDMEDSDSETSESSEDDAEEDDAEAGMLQPPAGRRLRRMKSNTIAPDMTMQRRARDEDRLDDFDDRILEEEGDDLEEDLLQQGGNFVEEIKDTFTRGVESNLPVDAIQLELASLKLSHDATIQQYSYAVLLAMLDLTGPPFEKAALVKAKKLIAKWAPVLSKFGGKGQDQLYVLRALEQACQRDAVAYAAAFRFFLQFLYEAEVVTEEYILSWEVASAPNDEDDMPSAQKLLREAAAPFFTFLKEEDEESSEGESSDEEDDDDDDDEDSD